MSQQVIKEILEKSCVIAIVGLSKDPDKDSHRVSAYLKKQGYRIIPINPFADEVLGEKSYPSLLDIPLVIQKTIEIVDVFRPPQDMPQLMDQVIALKRRNGKPLVVWMQLGIINEVAAEAGRNSGLTVVMNKCLMIEHNRLVPKS